ncbi:uncharacterized protein LOC125383497 [Haliotis rufescens]|uniref:uncharacterized protein LOC125383497 n=1 Tax=Haliotis rufescens TaxID=6454 RepID=UPI00201EDA17|nr:uncharacterized protein LOC125383497 [Haliotis rufescens]
MMCECRVLYFLMVLLVALESLSALIAPTSDVNPICNTTTKTLIPHPTKCAQYYNCSAPAMKFNASSWGKTYRNVPTRSCTTLEHRDVSTTAWSSAVTEWSPWENASIPGTRVLGQSTVDHRVSSTTQPAGSFLTASTPTKIAPALLTTLYVLISDWSTLGQRALHLRRLKRNYNKHLPVNSSSAVKESTQARP